MCLIAWTWQQHADCPLVVLANRDEFHARPAEPLHWWTDVPPLLAGRDLEAGGTWLGLDPRGRMAALTNRRGEKPPGAPSRGELPVAFLRGRRDAPRALSELEANAGAYAGFNLLLFDGGELGFGSNRESMRQFGPGTHAMANDALDEPIPKVELLSRRLEAWARSGGKPRVGQWLEWLADPRPLQDSAMSAVFVKGSRYGTRASTVVIVEATGRVQVIERAFASVGRELDTVRYEFERAS